MPPRFANTTVRPALQQVALIRVCFRNGADPPAPQHRSPTYNRHAVSAYCEQEMASKDWLPKSVIWLKHYDRHMFATDAVAGVTVGLLALPLAMAFAIPSVGHPAGGPVHCDRWVIQERIFG